MGAIRLGFIFLGGQALLAAVVGGAPSLGQCLFAAVGTAVVTAGAWRWSRRVGAC